MKEFDFWQFIAGVTLFIYAMSLIEDSLKHLAGRSFKKFLQRQSQSKFKMTLASTALTGILQSSSVVILIVLSFVGAGLIPLKAALAAALGSNLGTTLSSWLIAFVGFKLDFTALSFPLLGISLLGLLFFKSKTSSAYLTSCIIGFALLFIGLEWLKTSVNHSFDFSFFRMHSFHYSLFVLAGFLITGVVQSSSLTMAISLSALYNQLIPIENAAAIVIGSELGTSLKFLLASVKGNLNKKRLAWGNFIVNIFTACMASLILLPFLEFISNSLNVKDALTKLVVFQSGINFLALIAFYPFLGPFAGLLERRFKMDKYEHITRYLRTGDVVLPAPALQLAEKEVLHLMEVTLNLNKNILGLTIDENNGLVENLKQIAAGDQIHFEEHYLRLKFLQGEIQEFLSGIQSDQLNEVEVSKRTNLIQIARLLLRSAKNMKDIRHNLQEFEFSANEVISQLYREMKEMELDFYHRYQILIDQPSLNGDERMSQLSAENGQTYDKALDQVTQALQKNVISEIDSSSLLNVYREVFSSNKALIQALQKFNQLRSLDDDLISI